MLVFSQSSGQWIRVNTDKATFIHGCDILPQQRRRPGFFRLLTLGRSNEFQVGSQISGLRSENRQRIHRASCGAEQCARGLSPTREEVIRNSRSLPGLPRVVYPSLRSEDNTKLRKSYHCSSQIETFIGVCDNFMSERSSKAGAFRAVLCYVDNIDVLL